MNTNNEITSLKEHLLYLDKTDDKHFIDKIVELYEDGVDEETLQSICWQRYEIEDWLRDKSLPGCHCSPQDETQDVSLQHAPSIGNLAYRHNAS